MPHGQRFDETMSCGEIYRAAEEKPGLFAQKVRDPLEMYRNGELKQALESAGAVAA